MARNKKVTPLEAPRGRRTNVLIRTPQPSRDRFGRFTEWVARAMGTPVFLLLLSLFCVLWITWNSVAPEAWRFDDPALGFTALTLVLSLQASYAAPLILLAQNRQDDRDRVQIEQDRQRAERNLADTEYLAREVVALRMAINEFSDQVVTRDGLRHELRAFLDQIEERAIERADTDAADTDATDPDAAATDAAVPARTERSDGV